MSTTDRRTPSRTPTPSTKADRTKAMYARCRCCIAARVSKPAALHERSAAASRNELATAIGGAA